MTTFTEAQTGRLIPIDRSLPLKTNTFSIRTSIRGTELLFTFRWLRRLKYYVLDIQKGGQTIRQMHLTHGNRHALMLGVRTRAEPEFPDVLFGFVSPTDDTILTPTNFPDHTFVIIPGRFDP